MKDKCREIFRGSFLLLVSMVLWQALAGCQHNAEHGSAADQATSRESSRRAQKVRQRLSQIRASLLSKPLATDDRKFITDTAASGDIVGSGLAFLLMEDLLKKDAIRRDTVLEAYVTRLTQDRGVQAVLTLRNLEALLVPNVHGSSTERDAVIALIRKHQQDDRFEDEELSLADKLANSKDDWHSVLLVELILSKHSASQVDWVMDILKRKARAEGPVIGEFINLALRVVALRGSSKGP